MKISMGSHLTDAAKLPYGWGPALPPARTFQSGAGVERRCEAMRCKTGGRLFFFGVVAGSAMLFGSMLFGYGAQAGEDIRDLVLKGKPILDLRYRFEIVD